MVLSQQNIGIIGSGPSALVTAHILIKDGFTSVQLITCDSSPGGIWSKGRVYPGLLLNNVHGQMRFSSMEMEIPPDAAKTGGRLTGEVVSDYMESFATKFLSDKILYKTEVLNIKRDEKSDWVVKTRNLTTNNLSDLHFTKIVLCTGGCNNPSVPSYLSPHAAEASRFRGLVLHSSQFNQELPNIFATVKPRSFGSDADTSGGRIVIIGCGKSAQDMSAYLANNGRKVAVVYEQLQPYLATPRPLPSFFRKSRIFSALSPSSTLHSRLEWFLHTTWLGSKIVHFIFKLIGKRGFDAYKIPQGSPLRKVTRSLFWDPRIVDEGVARPTSFYALTKTGQIDLYTPTRAIGFDKDGHSILLSNGQKISAEVVILATGYRSSWETLFDDHTANELGIKRHILPPAALINDEWASYHSLQSPPHHHTPSEHPKPIIASSIYRGIVPAKNITQRDFAINGAIVTGNNGYVFEIVSHWISSYFLGDKLKLPSTPSAALEEADRHSAWCEKRFPGILGLMNESICAAIHLWSWPQATDQLLEDMHLQTKRSGGWWFNWVFKVMDSKDIENLTEERRALRKAGQL